MQEKITNKQLTDKEYKERVKNIYDKYNTDEINLLVELAQEELKTGNGNKAINLLVEKFYSFIEMYAKFIYDPQKNTKSETAKRLYRLLSPDGNKSYNARNIRRICDIIKSQYEYDELVNEFVIIFIDNIVRKYDHSKVSKVGISKYGSKSGHFVGFFFRFYTYYIDNWIIKVLRKLSKETTCIIHHPKGKSYKEETLFEEVIKKIEDPNGSPYDTLWKILDINDKFVFDPESELGKQLTYDERNIINLKYTYGYTIKEIAELLNINMRYIIALYNSAYSKIKKYVQKNNIKL